MTARPFEELVTEHGPVVMRVCRALLGPADADDAWSETFLSAMRAYPRLRPDSNIRGWLVTIAHNKAIDHVRAVANRPWPTGEPKEVPTIDRAPVDDALGDELRAALDALSFKQRGAVVYRYRWDDGLPGSEGGFHICTAWLIEAYLRTGRRGDAEELFQQMLGTAGPTGLLPEQYDPYAERGLGNHPQAYSHLGIIRSATALDM